MEEKDAQFWLGMWKSRCGDYLFAKTASTETSEVHALNLCDDSNAPFVIQPRKFGLRYDVASDPISKSFIVVTNKDKSLNNRLMITPTSSPNISNWVEFMPHSKSRLVDDVYVFKNHLVIEGRESSLPQIWIVKRGEDNGFDIKTLSRVKLGDDGELCDVSVRSNKEFQTEFLNLSYSSLTTPNKVLDMNMDDFSNIHVIKQTPVLNFDSNLYISRRFFAVAPDKTKIPMSLVCRKDVWDMKSKLKDPKPVHLYGYGSYGISIDPYFRRDILPLLDRGMIFAIAHIRGGGENGRHWYEVEGKYLTKRNTFSDFVACAEYLVESKITSPEIMSCEGRSAGGLLMGNVINMRPDLFKCAVAGVPFVDLMVTMCDPSIPLTTNEWYCFHFHFFRPSPNRPSKTHMYITGRNGEIRMNQSISITCYHTHPLTTFELNLIPIFSSQLDFTILESHIGNLLNGQANFALTKQVRILLLCVNSISQPVISLQVIAIAGYVRSVTTKPLFWIVLD